jgi:hypothetical protein
MGLSPAIVADPTTADTGAARRAGRLRGLAAGRLR